MSSFIFYICGIAILALGLGSTSAYGHTSVNVGEYEIEVGWKEEPPLVGFVNSITIEISELGEHQGVKTGVKSAFYNLDAIARFGGVTKNLDINVDPRPGHYFSKIIPTKTGTMSVKLEGEINGVSVDVEIPLEDVENTAVLDFPLRKGSSLDGNTMALQNSMKYLQEELAKIKSNPVGKIAASDTNPGIAYDFSVLSLSLAASAVVLGIIAMLKRN